MSTPDESESRYTLDDIAADVPAPPAEIDDERAKQEQAWLENQAKALGNTETAIRIGLLKKYGPLLIKLCVAYYGLVIVLIIVSAFHPAGFRLDPTVEVALIGAPILVGGLSLLAKLLRLG